MSEEKLKKIWQEVELERDKFSKDFAYKNFYSGSKKDLILIGINKDSSKGIMIRDESGRNALPKLSSSFQIERSFIEEKKSFFITIFSKETSLHEPFTYLISLIIKNIDYGLSPTLATKEAIEKFQKLFKSFGKLPSENQIVGLLGELFFVDQILKIKNDYWKGWIKPEKTIDYTYSEIDVEIKSSSYSGEDKITINRLNQLQYIKNRSRYLYYSSFIINPEGELSVPDLVNNILSQIDDKDGFREKLSKTKYKFGDKSLWLEKRYSHLETIVFKVDENFPRINSDSFKDNKIPDGITNIRYDLALNTINDFRIEKDQFFNNFKK